MKIHPGDMVRTTKPKPCGGPGPMYEGRVWNINQKWGPFLRTACGKNKQFFPNELARYAPTELLPVSCTGCCCCSDRVCEVRA